MRDFTLNVYKQYLEAIKSAYPNIMRFVDFFSVPTQPDSFAIIRHDVDRKPLYALRMAELEKDMNIQSSYYFRAKPHTFKPDVIKKVSDMGHEIGYHYESLSDANGNKAIALTDFEKNLDRFRDIVPVKTIAMHGNPLKPYDNRDLWRINGGRNLLSEKFDILGEVYLDIDYKNIAYVNDTGRNWTSSVSNRRDRVNSRVTLNIKDAIHLYTLLASGQWPRLVFQIHPERWAESSIEYLKQLLIDHITNLIKSLVIRN